MFSGTYKIALTLALKSTIFAFSLANLIRDDEGNYPDVIDRRCFGLPLIDVRTTDDVPSAIAVPYLENARSVLPCLKHQLLHSPGKINRNFNILIVNLQSEAQYRSFNIDFNCNTNIQNICHINPVSYVTL